MYKVRVKDKNITFISKQDTINYLYAHIQKIDEISKAVCMGMHTKEYTLYIWLVGIDKILLFFNPIDEREDCKISCSRKIEDINSPTFELKDENYALSGCSKYNLLSIEQAMKEIVYIMDSKDKVLTGNWYTW